MIFGETASSALKPSRTVFDAMSIPPTITASTIPAIIISAAFIVAPALEEHAVLNVFAGPFISNFSAIYVET